MKNTVFFREFKESDIDFVYKCKNDEKLNSLIVGNFRPFSYEDASKWVRGCMGNHDDFIFWAICSNTEDNKIIGWTSLAKIDKENKSASTHSIVIADHDYNDGFVWLETIIHLLRYAFEVLGLNRLYGVSIKGHKISNLIGDAFFMKTEGILRQACYKNDNYYDLQYNAILKDEYFAHKEAGDYEMMAIIRRLKKLRKR